MFIRKDVELDELIPMNTRCPMYCFGYLEVALYLQLFDKF